MKTERIAGLLRWKLYWGPATLHIIAQKLSPDHRNCILNKIAFKEGDEV
jgi:hypothetical protein